MKPKFKDQTIKNLKRATTEYEAQCGPSVHGALRDCTGCWPGMLVSPGATGFFYLRHALKQHACRTGTFQAPGILVF